MTDSNAMAESPTNNTGNFRNALGSFATGVTVVTAIGRNGVKVGMTANSFNSVSLDPALVLWSIGRKSSCFDGFMQAKAFAIHVLAADQQAVSNHFARSGREKFADLHYTSGIDGVPILSHYSACFQCSTESQYDGGDHVILVGKVIEFVNNELEPLLFYRGKYATL